MGYLFTSESVSAGHPDKICDQISDAVVDAALTIDPKSRVAVETLVTTDRVVMAGEVTCPKALEYAKIARRVIKKLGYTKPEFGFFDQSPIEVYVHQQSPDISVGVDEGGAGDQGLMFGYACRQTDSLMPIPIVLAHELARGMDELKLKHAYLRPDGKSQVTVKYEKRKPVGIERVVLAVPHEAGISNKELKEMLISELVNQIIGKYKFKIKPSQIIVNGTGFWEVGGPASDTGVTGRKIIVDTYGGWARHGGGCFSGKDPTKVDRSGAYAARWVAKNVISLGLADECEVQVAYVIGKAEPVSVMVETFGTEKKPIKLIREAVNGLTNFKVGEILDKLELRQPIFEKTAAYGHFGRPGFSWEEVTLW